MLAANPRASVPSPRSRRIATAALCVSSLRPCCLLLPGSPHAHLNAHQASACRTADERNIYRSERDRRGIFYTGIETTARELTTVELCGELDDMSRLGLGISARKMHNGGECILRFMSTAEELRTTDVRRKVAL